MYSPSRSASFAPSTPGHQVYAFVPANPSSLQSFIDQYRSQAKDVTVDGKVYLDQDF